jgi:hypothetical protein
LTLLDGTFLGNQSGEIHRMHVPEDASLHGSVGKRPDGKLELMNPFSKCVVQLPVEANGRSPLLMICHSRILVSLY